ncbi:hypothetical protein DFH05DRAFT_1522115 [Lentinula detonsa]|uniref:Uncharacterized protein n=1 Tax=Lentinula detonsa TaxID=2804962 RepID=A0A9W8U0D4_9AGAR|nr:hypothetical protein DFH05DRAFT_1522115 [Lentinula detonsa]
MGNLLWFFLGAGAATMYAKRRNHLEHEGRCSSHPHSARNISSSPEIDQPASTQKNTFIPSAPWNSHSASVASPTSGTSLILSSDPWAVEKERIREISSQVGDNVLDFSESTLDTLLSNIASMKAKIVQQRLDRERHEQDPLRDI